MRRWIRFDYVLPRLFLVVVFILLAEVGSGYLLKSILIRSGEKSVGARVEIGESRASLFRSQVVLQNLAIANPQSPMKNLITADRLELDFSTPELLRKRGVAERGVLRGIALGTARETSGALPDAEPKDGASEPSWLATEATELARNWMTDFATKFDEDRLNEFESVRLTEELIDRWPLRYRAIEERVRQLKQRASSLQDEVKQARANPLRYVDFLTQLPQEVESIQAEFDSLSREIAALPQLIEADRQAIALARQRDEAMIREKLQIDKIDSQSLTTYLCGERISGPLHNVLGWIRWARAIVPEQRETTEPQRQRGIDVQFPGFAPRPDLLVQTLDLDGSARLAGQPLNFRGVLSNLSDQPRLVNEPIELRVTTAGAIPMDVKAIIDRRGEVPVDELLVDCHGIMLPRMRLGKPGKFGLSLSASRAVLNVSLTLRGDDLTGDVQLVQNDVDVACDLGARGELAGLESTCNETLAGLDRMATRVSLSGTLDRPDWDIWSNVGPAVSEGLQRAMVRQLELKGSELATRARQRVDGRLAELERTISERQQALLPQLSLSQDQMMKIVGDLTGARKLNLEQLGRQLPIDSLFR